MKAARHTRLIILILCSILLNACSLATPDPTATPTATAIPPSDTPQPTLTPSPTSTRTPRPTSTPRPTATPNLAATAEYETMAGRIKEYVDAKYISSADGKYLRLDSYYDAWAQIDWYQWNPIDLANPPKNFVLRTDLTWESGIGTPNSSGCGFVFRLQSNRDHYVMYVGTDGYVHMAHNTTYFVRMGKGYYGKAAANGKANLTLIAEDNKLTTLVDDKFIKQFTGFEGKLLDGDLAFTIISGTNADFGTRCSFENIEFWMLGQ